MDDSKVWLDSVMLYQILKPEQSAEALLRQDPQRVPRDVQRLQLRQEAPTVSRKSEKFVS